MEFIHPAMWHDHDIDFVRWLHPAMLHVALESWQWIYQVAAPCNVIRGSGMTCHWIRPNIRHIGTLHLVSISTHHRSRHDILYLRNFIQTGSPSAEKNDVMPIFKMAVLIHTYIQMLRLKWHCHRTVAGALYKIIVSNSCSACSLQA